MTTNDRTVTVQRLGDFYEARGDSAQALHDLCGCTLTVRSECVLASFPYFSLLTFAARLASHDYRLTVWHEGGAPC